MCGIVGVSCPQGTGNAIRRAYDALRMMNHRGQDGSGIAAAAVGGVCWHKKSGLVHEVFSQAWLAKHADAAIGHNRYATQGISTEINLQPHMATCSQGQILVASNGDIPRYREIRASLEAKGERFISENDGELIAKVLARQVDACGSMIEAIRSLDGILQGAYAAVALFNGAIWAFRDPKGFRPLSLVALPDSTTVVASETVAFGILGADVKTYREVQAGAILEITGGTVTYHERGHEAISPCIFELIYFARPDSQVFDLPVAMVRRRIGWQLAREAQWTAHDDDVVVAVPDSANEIARGFAEALDVPLEHGLFRSHTSPRTFIQPQAAIRDESVRYKLNPLYLAVEDMRVLLVDDSIVRGTTIKKIVRMLKHAGAREVHLFIGSPQIRWPCFMGIATPTREELIANTMTIEEIVAFTGAASLRHVSLEGLKEATGPLMAFEHTRYERQLKPFMTAGLGSFRGRAVLQLARQETNNRCFACFSGSYPIPVLLDHL